jgi:hypothetical protein
MTRRTVTATKKGDQAGPRMVKRRLYAIFVNSAFEIDILDWHVMLLAPRRSDPTYHEEGKENQNKSEQAKIGDVTGPPTWDRDS